MRRPSTSASTACRSSRGARARIALPYRYPTDHTAAQVRAAPRRAAARTRGTSDRVRMAGRLDLIRRQGGLTFAVLRDRTGTIQLFVDTAVLGADRAPRASTSSTAATGSASRAP